MKRPTLSTQPRRRQEVPVDLVADILRVIRGQFYGDDPDKRWFQDQGFIRTRFILWPAQWLNERGVTLKPERFRSILLEVLNGIKVHGTTYAVRFWPGYLAHCVQQHFAHHGDEIYQEGKSLRHAVEAALLSARPGPAPDPVARMAEAYRISKATPRRRIAAPRQQLDLFKADEAI